MKLESHLGILILLLMYSNLRNKYLFLVNNRDEGGILLRFGQSYKMN